MDSRFLALVSVTNMNKIIYKLAGAGPWFMVQDITNKPGTGCLFASALFLALSVRATQLALADTHRVAHNALCARRALRSLLNGLRCALALALALCSTRAFAVCRLRTRCLSARLRHPRARFALCALTLRICVSRR